MGRWKHIPISKESAKEMPCGLPHVIGLWILRLVKRGYYRFEIYEYEDKIVIAALRSKKMKVLKEVEENE